MQRMVAGAKNEREIFKEALNARVAKEHPEKRGRPQWLYARLEEYRKANGRRGKTVSVQTCAYWLSGEKVAKQENATLLMGALGMSRGELFGESGDPRLAALIQAWQDIPEKIKNGIYAMVKPTEEADEEPVGPADRQRRA